MKWRICACTEWLVNVITKHCSGIFSTTCTHVHHSLRTEILAVEGFGFTGYTSCKRCMLAQGIWLVGWGLGTRLELQCIYSWGKFVVWFAYHPPSPWPCNVITCTVLCGQGDYIYKIKMYNPGKCSHSQWLLSWLWHKWRKEGSLLPTWAWKTLANVSTECYLVIIRAKVKERTNTTSRDAYTHC